MQTLPEIQQVRTRGCRDTAHTVQNLGSLLRQRPKERFEGCFSAAVSALKARPAGLKRCRNWLVYRRKRLTGRVLATLRRPIGAE
jgi:hypothetical protein